VSAARSRNMAAIRSKNTKPELVLRHLLTAAGLRYRLHRKGLPGRPDIVFVGPRVIVFCDGDFWHGRNWKRLGGGSRFKVRKKYWTQKIEGNMARDRRNRAALRKDGWRVLRFWEGDIKTRPEMISAKIRAVVKREHASSAAAGLSVR